MSADDIFVELSPAQILYRDETLLVVNKPAGLSTASSDGADDLVGRAKRFIAAERGVAARDVYVGAQEHLERDASGIVILTIDKRGNRGLAEQFERSTLTREFAVITPSHPKARALPPTQLRAAAVRAQLARQGDAVIGDAHNGGSAAPRAMCHASAITLKHPITGAAMRVDAPVPGSLRHAREHIQLIGEDATYRDALIAESLSKRCSIGHAGPSEQTNALRLIHGAADGFAGLSIDLYDRWLVVHVFDERWMPQLAQLIDSLRGATRCAGVYVKQHPRQKNELGAEEIATLAGDTPFWGEAAPDPLRIVEHGVPLFVRLGDGLRTGIFLDQRNNRHHVRQAASGKRVLNLFAYTCGFSVAALVGDAEHVTSVDASALVMARCEPSLSELTASTRHRSIVGDCFDVLRDLKQANERFDLIIVDPPSYASTTSGRFRLRRDYADLVAATTAVTSPGASILCCTNHHGTTDRDLRAFAAQGVTSAGRQTEAVRLVQPPLDFGVLPGAAPELKSVWVTLR